MSLQLEIPSSVITESIDNYQIEGNGLYFDGTLNIEYLASNEKASTGHRSPKMNIWRDFKREVLIAHAFLLFVLVVITCVPQNLLQLRSFLPGYLDIALKRLLDIWGAVFGLVISSPVFFYLPLLIRLDSRGEVIFKQKRIGVDRRGGDRRKISLAVPYDRRRSDRRVRNVGGRPFEVYKFRSMQENAEEATGPTWAKKKDQRVTRVGKIMRPCHLDEIPQFVNVLKGDMSLVGPRPERPEFVPHLNREIPNYGKRLESKPGITGLAQICCGYDSTVNDVARKLAYDLYYIRNRSVLFDIVILFKTIQIVVLPNNRLSFELKRLPDSTSDADDLLPLEEASHTAQNGRRLSRAAN